MAGMSARGIVLSVGIGERVCVCVQALQVTRGSSDAYRVHVCWYSLQNIACGSYLC